MGEGTAGVEERSLRAIEREIERLRMRLDRSLAELDRRRHELTDLKLQARRHPVAVAGAGTAALLFDGGRDRAGGLAGAASGEASAEGAADPDREPRIAT